MQSILHKPNSVSKHFLKEARFSKNNQKCTKHKIHLFLILHNNLIYNRILKKNYNNAEHIQLFITLSYSA